MKKTAPKKAAASATGADRQRAFRQRMTEKGAVQVSVWVPRSLKQRLHAYVDRLMKEGGLK